MTPGQRREYQTVLLATLLRPLARYLPGGAGLAGFWSETFARCVNADLLQLLVSFSSEGPADPASAEHSQALVRLLTRAEELASREPAAGAGPRDWRTVALAPVFDRVRLLAEDGPALTHLEHADLKDLAEEPPIFPQPGRPAAAARAADHAHALRHALDRLLEWLNADDFPCACAHLLSLLHRFTACVPGPVQGDPPDLSLYDHLRVASALAACLYRHHAAAGTLTPEGLARPPAGRCVLLVGDLSGIQDYLFDIATVGAGGVARRLRARSFFLQMLAEVAGQKVLRAFDLPPANLLMAAGGKFYVLLPALADTRARVEALQAGCDAWLLEAFHGTLALNLAAEPVADGELGTGEHGGFGAALGRLFGALARRKQQRLRGALVREGRWQEADFVRRPFPENTSACAACRRFPAERASEPGGEADVCRACFQDVRLGRLLSSAHFVGFYDRPVGGGTRCFDWTFVVAAAADDLPPGPVQVTRLNGTDLTPVADRPATFRFLANYVPREPDGTPWTFEDVAARRHLAEGESSPALLAVVKADVDYLGQVFQDGLHRDRPPRYDTAARVAALSRQLDLFFSAWLGWLLGAEFPEVYAVYSGGDDLLLVSPRSRALALVGRVYEAFARYTHNPELTLSAGVAVVKPRLPLAHTVLAADGGARPGQADGPQPAVRAGPGRSVGGPAGARGGHRPARAGPAAVRLPAPAGRVRPHVAPVEGKARPEQPALSAAAGLHHQPHPGPEVGAVHVGQPAGRFFPGRPPAPGGEGHGPPRPGGPLGAPGTEGGARWRT
jgi:CRISPR-associated protein Csm1